MKMFRKHFKVKETPKHEANYILRIEKCGLAFGDDSWGGEEKS